MITITPEHALVGLLALGGLDYGEVLRFTGWSPDKADAVLGALLKAGRVRCTSTVNQYLSRYWLTEDTRTEPRERRAQARPSSHSATDLSSERSRKSFSFPAGTSRTA